jgi:LuxR family transcriptional regulator
MQLFLSATNESELFLALSNTALGLGFAYCAYGMRMPLPLVNPKTVMLNNYSQAWQDRYAEQNYLAVDPTVAHGLSSVTPLVWSDQLFTSSREFWHDARDHGLRVGWAQSSFDAKGVVGMLTLARSDDELSAAEIRENSLKMSWLVQAAHESFARLISTRSPMLPVQLTSREIEVLRWTADGKTSGDVGQIMNISERTVNFHVNNAIEKLGTANKTAAVIKAALLRLL